MLVKSLFPTAVGFEKFDPGFTSKQKNFILDLDYGPNQGNLTSKDRYLAKHKILKNFVDFCDASINKYFQNIYQPKNDVKLRITQMWANSSIKGQWHHVHAHPNSFLSAVFYMQCNDSDEIQFYKQGYNQLLVKTENFNEFNASDWFFPIAEDMLVIFPSSLTHSVPIVSGEKTRLSISMNTFPLGVLGQDEECTECIL
jgi:uncharacterized protein (TIGR02466 family)